VNIHIKKAQLSDAEALRIYYTSLLDENIPYIRDNLPPTLEREKDFINFLLESSGDLLLAVDNSDIVGMLQIERSSHYQEEHRMYIGLSVKKEYRGNGLGTRLLNKAKTWASDNSILSIELEVIETNPSISLYKKLGYKTAGRVSNGFKVKDKYYDVLLMQLEL